MIIMHHGKATVKEALEALIDKVTDVKANILFISGPMKKQ